MDNTPRGRIGKTAPMPRPNNPRMLWVDAISQQALAASCIATLAGEIGRIVGREAVLPVSREDGGFYRRWTDRVVSLHEAGRLDGRKITFSSAGRT